MKKTCSTPKLLLVLGLFLLGLESPALGEIPSTLSVTPAGPLVFVRSEVVLTPDGEINPALFAESDAATLRIYMKLPEENGCVRLRGVIRDYPNLGPLSSIKEASLQSKLVATGVVVAQAQGFSGSEAGTLVEIQPEEVLKGVSQGVSSSYFAFFPIGDFTLGGRSFCAFNPDWPSLPAIGDRLLLFIRNQIPSSNYLPLLDGTDVIVLRKNGVELPPKYTPEKAHQTLRPEGLLDKVRSYLGGGRP